MQTYDDNFGPRPRQAAKAAILLIAAIALYTTHVKMECQPMRIFRCLHAIVTLPIPQHLPHVWRSSYKSNLPWQSPIGPPCGFRTLISSANLAAHGKYDENSTAKESGASKSKLDDAIVQEKEKQTRAPWNREGSSVPPVARRRSAGAMTKGTPI